IHWELNCRMGAIKGYLPWQHLHSVIMDQAASLQRQPLQNLSLIAASWLGFSVYVRHILQWRSSLGVFARCKKSRRWRGTARDEMTLEDALGVAILAAAMSVQISRCV